MIHRLFPAAGILFFLLILLVIPCFASDMPEAFCRNAGHAVCLTTISDSVQDADPASSAEEEPLPPKYAPENARRNIAIVAVIVVVIVAAASILVRTWKGY